MRLKKLLAVFLCTLSIPSAAACSLLPEEEVFNSAAIIREFEGNEFSMTTVKRGNIRDYHNIPCEYRESNNENIMIPFHFTVKEICVKVGDEVKPGDVLLRLEADYDESRIDEIKYQIKRKKAEISQEEHMCDLEVKKQKLVLDDEISIRAIKENYDMQISGLKGELSALNKQLKSEEEELNNYNITATISGRVTYVDRSVLNNYDEGFRGPGGFKDFEDKRTITVSDGSMPYFYALKDSSEYIKELSEGDSINVVASGDVYEAKVHFPKKNKAEVYFLLDYVPDNIEDGNIANAEYIVEEHKDVLYLPDRAVHKMGDSYVIYYEDENGLKSAKEVEIGLKAENKVEIVSGLEFDEAVIVR